MITMGQEKLTKQDWIVIKNRFLSGESYVNISEDYPIGYTTLAKRLKEKGITVRPKFKIPKQEWAIIRKRYLAGESCDTIAKDYSVVGDTINLGLKRIGVKIRSIYKVTEEEWKMIMNRYLLGESCRKIAKDYPFGYMMIYNELKRREISFRPVGIAPRGHEECFAKIDSEEKAYILGILYADGCNYRNGISLALHQKDEEILIKIKNNIDPGLSIHRYERERQGKKEYTASLRLQGVALAKRLSELGCVPKKSLVLRYPDWMTSNLHRHFIRGYFDGDGCFSIRKKGTRIGYTHMAISGTMSFLNSTRDVIQEKLGIKGNVGRDDKLDMWGVCRLVYNGFKKVIPIGEWMYEDAIIYMERKHVIFHQIIIRYNEVIQRKES